MPVDSAVETLSLPPEVVQNPTLSSGFQPDPSRFGAISTPADGHPDANHWMVKKGPYGGVHLESF